MTVGRLTDDRITDDRITAAVTPRLVTARLCPDCRRRNCLSEYTAKALRAVRAWLTPWLQLHRYWTAWTDKPPPHELQQLLNAVANGHPLNLYLSP